MGSLQVGISNAKLEKVICNRDVKAVFIKGFYEQTPCCLCTKRCNQTGNDMRTYESSSKGVTAVGLKKKVIYYLFTNTKRAKQARKFCVFFLQKVGLIVKFYKSLSQ